MVGRDVEEARLRALVRDVAAGQGRSVLVEGEPGIGKSALVSAGLSEAAGLRCRLLRGAADEFGGRFPLRVLLDCFARHGVSDLAAMTGGESSNVVSGSYDPVLAAMEQLLEVVDRLCAESPVVLAVDDLQWADEPSLTVWAQLSRSVSQLPLLLVAACRPEPLRMELAGLRRALHAQGAVMMRLGPLSRKDTVALLADLVGAPPGPGLIRLAVQAGGNPLYVRELVDVLAREGRLRVEPGVAAEVERDGAVGVPVSLRAAIDGRIESMSQATQRVLRSAAMLGSGFSVAELATVLGRPPADLADALMEAYQANVLVDRGGQTVFRHPLIRQALYEGVPEGLRAALHRQAAQALADAGVPVERVAEHLGLASGVMDSWTLDWLVANGAALVNRASQPAIDLLSRAAEHVPRTDPRREVIESWMVAALRRMLRFGDLRRWARAALASDGISAEHRLEMSWALAYSLLYSDPPEGARVAREALASGDVGRWGARVRSVYALILAADRHCGDADAAIGDAYAASERAGDRWAMATALHAEALILRQSDISMAVDRFERALALMGDDPRAADQRMAVQSNLIRHLGAMGRMEEADATLADMLAFGAKYPSAMSQSRAQVYAAQRHYDIGQWDDALAELESVEPRPEHGYITVMGLSTGALIAGHRDDRPAMAAQLGLLADMPISEQVVRSFSAWVVLARALAAERDGRLDQAFGVLAPRIDPELDVDVGDRFRWISELVRIAVAVGERDVAAAATRLAAGDAAREGLPVQIAAADACQGLLTGDPAPLLAAAEGFLTVRWSLDRGMALENAAVLLGGRGELAQARVTAATAMQEYTTLAANWDLTRMEARMRKFGIRRGPRGPRGRPSAGWDALTPTELRVAFFVADGLSNPAVAAELFLSRRTVQTHVSHILAKLGARSRAEVAGEAVKHRGDLPAPGSKTAS
ncbi:MAG TPA: AAA family ATPase [Streptosporangiaceae bacterium]|nr:AAA family ATPase [Streptosporangiaceae bacterium]